MDNAIEIIKQFEGIIGAVIGSVFTLIATYIIQKLGKLNIKIKEYKGNYMYSETYDLYESTTERKENYNMCGYEINFVLNIYNSSNLPKVMSNIGFEIYQNKKRIESYSIRDNAETIHNRGCSQYKYSSIYNFEPKKIVELKLGVSIEKECANLFEEEVLFKIKYLNENGKTKYFQIYKGQIKQPKIIKDIK